MRMIFGVLSLLLALVIVGSLARKQLQAMRMLPSTASVASAVAGGGEPSRGAAGGERGGRLDAFPGAVAADPNMTVPQQSQSIQNQIKQDTQRALQQGAARSGSE